MKKAEQIQAAYQRYKQAESSQITYNLMSQKEAIKAKEQLCALIKSTTLEEMNEPCILLPIMRCVSAPILWYAMHHRPILRELIVQAHPDTLLYPVNGVNIFMYIARYGLTIEDGLIALRAKECTQLINTTDASGSYPIHIAATQRNDSVLGMLIRNGAKVNAVNIVGQTALHLACMLGAAEPVKTLVSAGADVNALDNVETPPIYHSGIQYWYPNIVETLLIAGANLEQPFMIEGRQRTIGEAISLKHGDAFKRVQKECADIRRCLSFAESITKGVGLSVDDLKWYENLNVVHDHHLIRHFHKERKIIDDYIANSSRSQHGVNQVPGLQ